MQIKNPVELIQWLLDNKLVTTSFNQEYQEQMIEITDFGITVNEMLMQLKTTSEAAKKTNKLIEDKNKEKDFQFLAGTKFQFCKKCVRFTLHSWSGNSAYDGELECQEH